MNARSIAGAIRSIGSTPTASRLLYGRPAFLTSSLAHHVAHRALRTAPSGAPRQDHFYKQPERRTQARPKEPASSEAAATPETATDFVPVPAEAITQISDIVDIPADSPDATLTTASSAYSVLAHSALMVGRQLEMMNILIGYEQANKYSITDASGNNVGFIAEDESTFTGSLLRQLMRTRRAFGADILDRNGQLVLKVRRPVKWLLNSTISVLDSHDQCIGEVKQSWHPWRRKYDLFVGKRQFAVIDVPLLAWDFEICDEGSGSLGSINRNFSGFAREIFTDSGQYVIRMDATEQKVRSLALDERAVMLACAINIDIDYFSRHSNTHGGFLPVPVVGATSVPAPVPPVGPGAGMPMPMPIIIPGSGEAAPQGTNSTTEASTSDPGQTDYSIPPAPTPPPPSPGTNQWGDDGFLTDEQAGVSSGEGLSGWTSVIKDFFEE
ncbi:Scramblase-domain-containing protein [Polychytrium aggregatum]|uniref:Scramblase-domain-containing protein n=1 Tax=Polychytrium aggregatum TaxID=110093 RepID=UPI0022FDD6EC|nr:Scramblase-domain-containing protein [Polychytrium aggregatum]KAI9203480.1 Scramblase-domain-containing protein [Polychytrium aggregatum]